jgi:LPPG:FO 2-phospho-L-lactate transferase
MIVALAGGVGAARFLEGLIRVIPQRELTVIGNVGDDIEVHGLHVCPDLDIVLYTLAGIVDQAKGWGIRNDTFTCQERMKEFGCETWFNIGDKDLATHIYRTEQLRKGRKLSHITDELVRKSGLQIRLIPSTDDVFQTHVVSNGRKMHFQEYMVKLQTKPSVQQIIFLGSQSAEPTRGILQLIQQSSGVIISPSNPIVSIGAILAVPRIRAALQKRKRRIVGISPIIGGRTIRGPADKLMKSLGFSPSVVGVAEIYRDFLDTLIIDRVDEDLAERVEKLGIRVVVADTVMKKLPDKIRLARIALRELSG